MNKKKVYLVGSGPGDLGLLTIRAKELIEKCDVLIYDYLVSERIVSLANGSCEKIYVGKSGASHTMEQDDINRLIVKKALEKSMVVRLKGGDPYIFGRGGEEAEYCLENGIEFEVVNGISSAYAAPACAGIPVTNRGISSSVAFITGHEDPVKMESDIKWDKLATGVQTLVFLMGVKNLPFIIGKLRENGLDKSTPAAVIENGCRYNQRTVVGTLDDIAQKVEKAGVRPPSIIVVGGVVSMSENLNWFERRPLFGKRIIVTRNREKASELSSRLTELGAEVIETPVIKIMPPENTDDILKSIENLKKYDWIIFTSANGVDYFFKYLSESKHDTRALASNRVCAIGSATADRLKEFGVTADLIPAKFISGEILKALEEKNEIKGKSFLLPRADIAQKDIAEGLVAGGASAVHDIIAYRTASEDSEDIKQRFKKIKDDRIDLITFTSSSTVVNFDKMIQATGSGMAKQAICAAIGPITGDKAVELGYNVEISASTYTIEGLVEAILDYYGNKSASK